MKKIMKKGFTLIELLVVITIIGILATGGISIYTTQIQKARDSTRLSHILELEASVEQVYQDNSEYPQTDTFLSQIGIYLKKIPIDPKHGQPCSNTGTVTTVDCAYSYLVGDDINGIILGAYEFSTAFENSGNLTSKAANTVDGGNDFLRKEVFGSDNNINTSVAGSAIVDPTKRGACAISGTSPTNENTLIVIAGTGDCL